MYVSDPVIKDIQERIYELNTLFKMFDIKMVVTYWHDHRAEPFFVSGVHGGMAQGSSLATIDEVEELAHEFINSRPQ